MNASHDDLLCGIAPYAWDLCPGCSVDGYEVVKARYEAAERGRYLVKHPEHVKESKELPART